MIESESSVTSIPASSSKPPPSKKSRTDQSGKGNFMDIKADEQQTKM